ncbi:predicted protein [Nematostella vectensis]|uniref:RNA helicase n=1 Tax=Nematostella vectensis TaxID=45351 RepID=A7RQ16_NEMVE|nr:predicted protein [Nematostella vectensis]|eukprot:XP_001638545.1 predicted protein [Nematostella vectensis]
MATTVVRFRGFELLARNYRLLLTRWRSFGDLGLHENLVARLRALKIQYPSEIQTKALPIVSVGGNTVINAETGSGKTLCYLLPIVNRLLTNPSISRTSPYALILLPTVELCHQVDEVLKSIAGPDITSCVVHHDSRLHVNHPIIMAIPGALLSYRMQSLDPVKVVVTDEADFLTTSGGKDVWRVLNYMKYGEHIKMKKKNYAVTKRLDKRKREGLTDRQFVFVAATLPSRGKKASYNVLKHWLPNCQMINSEIAHQKLPTVDFEYRRVENEKKLNELLVCLDSLLRDSLEHENEMEDQKKNTNRKLRVLVFANTAKHASKACAFLTGTEIKEEKEVIEAQLPESYNSRTIKDGLEYIKVPSSGGHTSETSNSDNSKRISNTNVINLYKEICAELHGHVPLHQRVLSLEKFKNGEIQVLICTDIASRGLDIPNVTHVIQLDFATDAAQMLHRVGRTARAGSHGKVVNFITKDNEELVNALRACDNNSNEKTYENIFSRNRMFRRRLLARNLTKA